jgi:hypothetical protein
VMVEARLNSVAWQETERRGKSECQHCQEEEERSQETRAPNSFFL